MTTKTKRPTPKEFAKTLRRRLSPEVLHGLISQSGSPQWVHDPLLMVQEIFPWGELGRLENEEGPDEWQTKVLKELGEKSKQQADGTLLEAIQIAVKSGHGVGKTALIAWIIIWFIKTRTKPQIVVTANTKNQLETKTWRELSVWHRLSSIEDLFERTATKFYLKTDPETSFAACIPWNKDKPEAFAGTHEEHVLVLFDEGSDIAESIWETTEGAMTTPGAIWIVFGNPTKNTGRFRECWGSFAHRWSGHTVDSRTAKMANSVQIQNWLDDYGEDSDFAKVRVLGEFPSSAVSQFISESIIDAAQSRNYNLLNDVWNWAPVVIGVDVARFGDDQSVIYVRQGLQTHDVSTFRSIDTMQLVNHVVLTARQWSPKTIFVDEVGVGAGVVDRLKQLGYDMVIGVNGGSSSTSGEFFNLRAETWSLMRDWLGAGGAIPDLKEFKSELIGIEYGFDGKGRLQLEKKEDMKKRGLASPDIADALSMTFSMPIALDHPQVTLNQAQRDWNKITGMGSNASHNLEF